jgi:hypothetical protein
VNAFWSITMYRMPEILLVDNPIKRYLLNSTMLDRFTYDADGGLTLYVQNASPGKDKESNWLPAPKAGSCLSFASTGQRQRPWTAGGRRPSCSG